MDKESGVIELMRSLFSQHNGDYVTSVDEKGVILIKTLHKGEGDQAIEQIAQMILDMLNTCKGLLWNGYFRIEGGFQIL